MLKRIAKTKKNKETLSVFDARPWLNAQANRLKGGGFENIQVYTNIELTFCDIENIHAVSNAFEKMSEIPETPQVFNSKYTYGPKIEESGYL